MCFRPDKQLIQFLLRVAGPDCHRLQLIPVPFLGILIESVGLGQDYSPHLGCKKGKIFLVRGSFLEGNLKFYRLALLRRWELCNDDLLVPFRIPGTLTFENCRVPSLEIVRRRGP